MPNDAGVALLKQGASVWNASRKIDPTLRPDLAEVATGDSRVEEPSQRGDPLRKTQSISAAKFFRFSAAQ
jgi:hypothetical protein